MNTRTLLSAISKAGKAKPVLLGATCAGLLFGPVAQAQIEEIVTTARKTEENLQEVPVAVTALSGDELKDLGVATLEDITAQAPNIKVNAGRGTNNTVNAYIRGVGQNDPLWGSEPGVGIYIDDVYIARPQGALLDVYDIERLEVLRGPQGTLYGKNTLAGAIKYITKEIDGEATGNVSVSVGSYGQFDVTAGGSMPISDNFFIGGAVGVFTRDGYGEVVEDDTFGQDYEFNNVGDDVSDKDITAFRGNLTWLLSDTQKLKLTFDSTTDDSNARAGARQTLFGTVGEPIGGGSERYDVRSDMPVDQEKTEISGYALTYSNDLSDAWSGKVILAGREGDTVTFIDFESLNANLFNVPAEYDDEQTSAELQVNYTGDSINAVFGLYLFDGDACGSFNVVLSTTSALTQGCVNTESTSIYGQADWAIGDATNLTFGLRADEDKKTSTVFVQPLSGGLAGNETAFDVNNLPSGITVSGDPDTDYTNSRTFDEVSPRISIDHSPSEGLLVFASYSEGFKSGGFDMRGNQSVNENTDQGFEPEIVKNIELGLKSNLLNNTVQLNFTLFDADYEDVQIRTQQFVDVNGVQTNSTDVLNAGNIVNKGAELEVIIAPTDSLTLDFNYGYLDVDVKEFIEGGVNIANSAVSINSPRVSAYMGATYDWAMWNGDATVRAGLTYKDEHEVQTVFKDRTNTTQEAYSLVNASFIFRTGNWRFSADGKNLTDRHYTTSAYDFSAAASLLFFGAPRTLTLTAGYEF